jgi:hypothetical protein
MRRVWVASSMFGALRKRGWRCAIGVIAAYAFVLQAFLAYSMASQAAAMGWIASDSVFVICTSQNDAQAPDHGDGSAKPTIRCPLCTLAASATATLPDPVSLPAAPTAITERLSFVSADACISFHRARAGLSRAPPQNV